MPDGLRPLRGDHARLGVDRRGRSARSAAAPPGVPRSPGRAGLPARAARLPPAPPGPAHTGAPVRAPAADDPSVPRPTVGRARPGRPARPRRPAVPAGRPGPAAPAAAPTGAGDRPATPARKLVPTCGVLWGVAPGALHRRAAARRRWPRSNARPAGTRRSTTPTTGASGSSSRREQEIAIARQPGRAAHPVPQLEAGRRLLGGDRQGRPGAPTPSSTGSPCTSSSDFPEPVLLHRAPRGRERRPGRSRLRLHRHGLRGHVPARGASGCAAHGVDNMVTVLVHMAYVPHATQNWFDDMYPGDDVVDWIGLDVYAYSDPGYGHGDFAELLNRKLGGKRELARLLQLGGHPAPAQAADDRRVGRLVVADATPATRRTSTASWAGRLRRFPRDQGDGALRDPAQPEGPGLLGGQHAGGPGAYRGLGRLPIFQVAVTPRHVPSLPGYAEPAGSVRNRRLPRPSTVPERPSTTVLFGWPSPIGHSSRSRSVLVHDGLATRPAAAGDLVSLPCTCCGFVGVMGSGAGAR